MTAPNLAKHYPRLAADERFRLANAAAARNDATELARLQRSARRVLVAMPDTMPFDIVLIELPLHVFIELADDAAAYRAALEQAAATSSPTDPEMPEREALDVALALGYALATKHAGWIQFCRDWRLPADLWSSLPGATRLDATVALTQSLAFTAAETQSWLVAHGADDADLLTPASYAATLEDALRSATATCSI